MNTSIHIPDSLARRLTNYIERENKEQNISRNKAIVEAIEDWLDARTPVKEWSPDVTKWCSLPQIEDGDKLSLDLAREEQDWGDFSL